MKRNDIVKTINGLKGEEGHQQVLKTYNAQKPLPRGYKLKQSDPWCAGTVSAVFLMNGGCDFAECSCREMVNKAKALGIWKEDDAYRPQIGDIIQYDWQDSGKGDDIGEPDHVGIVIRVDADGNGFTVREGNKGGTVGNRSMKRDGRYIRGFILPQYEDDAQEIEQPAANSTPAEEKPANESKNGYIVGRTYTIYVQTALNVRRGAGTNYSLVGYNNLTADAKKHATGSGALRNGTRVTCKEVRHIGNDVWMRIPSGWICAISGRNVYVK